MNSVFEQLSTEQQQLIERHLDLVIDANKRINLTRIDDKEEGMLLHVEDSLSALPELNGAPSGRYGDLGSGGGFPGIPLAIATGRDTTLIDARMKKMDALAGIIDELGLQDRIAVYAGRAELLAKTQANSYAALTARALAKLSVLMELASPLLVKGGRLICYKSHVEQEEMDHALKVQKLTGMKKVSDREFMVEDYSRRIIVFEKVWKPQIKLPRQEGFAQKKPL